MLPNEPNNTQPSAIIGQTIPDVVETEPRLNYDNPDVLRSGLLHLRYRISENLDVPHYREYHCEVIDAALKLVGCAAVDNDTTVVPASQLSHDAIIERLRSRVMGWSKDVCDQFYNPRGGGQCSTCGHLQKDHEPAKRLREDVDALIAAVRRVGGYLACHVCGKPAYCIGSYEGDSQYRPACDACCGHGNEDGWCRPLDEAIVRMSEWIEEANTNDERAIHVLSDLWLWASENRTHRDSDPVPDGLGQRVLAVLGRRRTSTGRLSRYTGSQRSERGGTECRREGVAVKKGTRS